MGAMSVEKPLRIYMGNEAGGLDSACCAIALSYACSIKYPEWNHAPVLSFPSSYFNLKTEVRYAMSKFGIEANMLNFLQDEIDVLKEISRNGKLEIILVDHNNVLDEIKSLKSNIIMVIDHHRQVEPSLLPASIEKRMELTGSCSSLVAEYIEETLDIEISSEIAELITMTILIDQANLSPNQLVHQID